jgi:hypothetical protein
MKHVYKTARCAAGTMAAEADKSRGAKGVWAREPATDENPPKEKPRTRPQTERKRNTDTEWGETGDSDEDEQTCAATVGQGCAWCLVNHTDIPLFFLSFIILYLSINRCCYCVVVVAIVSALMCMRFPLLNATLWSALIVLYLHKDWNINFGNVKIAWNRAT